MIHIFDTHDTHFDAMFHETVRVELQATTGEDCLHIVIESGL